MARVMVAARCRSGLGIAKRGSMAHRVKSMAAAFNEGHVGGVRYAAYWMCGGGSADFIPLPSEPAPRSICERCELNRWPVVYRCFGTDGQLLYIGSTVAQVQRLEVHRSSTPWWSEVDRVTYEAFQTVTAARIAEHAAIRSESPIYNEVH